jgi:hypothetical protein
VATRVACRFFEDLVRAGFDPDALASQPVALNGHEHGTQSFDLVQKPVDQADRVQHCQTHALQAFCYPIDHRVPSVSMTSFCDMNVRNREAESQSLVNGGADDFETAGLQLV